MTRWLALALVLPLLALACSDDDTPEEPESSPAVTVVATPRPGTTALPGATVDPTVTIDSFNPRLQLKGVYRMPGPPVASNPVVLPERPKTAFAAWNGGSVVVYDTQTGEAHDFGPGSLAQPAFGGTSFVFTTADNDIYVVDLTTMERRYVARGILAYFLGDNHIVINPGNNMFYGVNIDSGERVDLSQVTEPLLKSMAAQRWGGSFQGEWLDGRYAIRLASNPNEVCEATGVEQRVCLADVSSRWLVEDVLSGEILLAFEADRVEPAGPGQIVLATTPVCAEANWITDCPGVLSKLEAQNANPGAVVAVDGTTNIFLVDLATGDSTFVATISYDAVTGRWPMNWPLVANESYVAWTESYCGEPRGVTRIYHRATAQITELNASEWLTLAPGRLGFGEFGAVSIVDPATLQYLAVLPDISGVSWSPDLRYAAVGQGFSRGGVCE